MGADKTGDCVVRTRIEYSVVRSIDCYWNRLIASDSSHKPGQKKLVSILGGLNLSGCMEGLVGFSFLEMKHFSYLGEGKLMHMLLQSHLPLFFKSNTLKVTSLQSSKC